MLFLYKWMLQLFGWPTWVSKQSDALQSVASLFHNQFNKLGVTVAFLVMLSLVILGVVLYYFVWSNGTSKMFKYRYRLRWWVIWWISSSAIVSIVTPLILRFGVFYKIAFKYNDALAAVSLCNFLYSIILFAVFSIIIVKVAPKLTNASCTPF